MTRISKLVAGLTSLALSLAILSVSNPAGAAVTAASVTASNPTPGATSNLDISLTGYQTTTPVKCIAARFSGGYSPAATKYDYESGAQGWAFAWGASSTVASSTTYAHSGTKSLSILNSNITGSGSFATSITFGSPQDYSVQGDTISAWVYAPVGTGSYTAVFINYNNAYASTSTGTTTLTPGVWTRVVQRMPSSLSTNIKQLDLQINVNGAANNAGAYIDDIQVGPSVSTNSDSDIPFGVSAGSATATGSFLNNASFTQVPATDSQSFVFTNSTGSTPVGSALSIGAINQADTPSGQTVFVSITTYSGPATSGVCSGSILDGPVNLAYATTPGVAITATVDPVLSFTIAALVGTSCNGATATGSSSAASVSLGRATAGVNVIAGQKLSIGTNANGGYRVSVRSSGVMSDGRGNTIANFASTNASPATFSAAGTANFGYTTDHTLSGATTRFQTNKWAGLSSTDAEVIYGSTTTAADAGNVCYQLGVNALTPAATYSTTVIYSALPSF